MYNYSNTMYNITLSIFFSNIKELLLHYNIYAITNQLG